jgi:hypothetical protein
VSLPIGLAAEPIDIEDPSTEANASIVREISWAEKLTPAQPDSVAA